MDKKKENTWYAPAERADLGTVLTQHQNFQENQLLIQTLESIKTAVLILNKQRQIVFANPAFIELLEETELSSILGLRVGEALDCVYSGEMAGGCGTSEYCRECGAVRAMLNSLNLKMDVQECRITLKEENRALDLRVMAAPMELSGQLFTVFTIIDIAGEKRSQALERLFLHDVKNTAGTLQGFSQLLIEERDIELEKVRDTIRELADTLLDEIDSYGQLKEAENSELKLKQRTFHTLDLLEKIKNQYLKHKVANGKNIRVASNSEDVVLMSDESILGRILGNMIKNALEACKPGDLITLSCRKSGDRFRVAVHNPGWIPREVQLQIFQRSFSTKGSGRGLGTYSIRLLSEQYLGGKVGFTSSESEGTTFYGEYPVSLTS